jgi:hypothetical protein
VRTVAHDQTLGGVEDPHVKVRTPGPRVMFDR